MTEQIQGTKNYDRNEKEKGYFQAPDNIGFSIQPFPKPFKECLSDALETW